MTSTEELRVAVIDAVPISRRGLAAALSGAGFAVDEPVDLSEWTSQEGPKAVVFAVGDPGDLALLRELRAQRPDLVVVAVLMDWSAADYREALEAGAAPVLSDSPTEELVAVLQAATQGRVQLPADIAQAIAEGRAFGEPTKTISDEEVEWLRLLATGMTAYELSQRTERSERDLYRALHDLYVRMGVANRMEALMQAVRWGLVREEEDDR